MNKILKSILAASVLMLANTSTVHALVVEYDVTGVIYEPLTQNIGGDTTFNGSFGWDGASVSNLHGTMNSSMYFIDDGSPIPPGQTYYPLMHLDYQLAQSVDGDIVTVSSFLKDTTDVFYGGGYHTGDSIGLGYTDYINGRGIDSFAKNDNAYISFSFNKTTMEGIVETLVYGDCTAGGMMGQICMTGHSPAINSLGEPVPVGSMSGFPDTLTISEAGVSAVPVPAAVWLYGSALAGLIGVSRKRDLPT